MNLTRKQHTVLILALVTICGTLAAVWFVNRGTPGSTSQQPGDPAQTTAPSEGVNLNPPTEEDKKEVEDNKNQIVDKLDNPKPSQSSATIKPFLTRAEFIADASVNAAEAAGYISSVIEDGGSCRYIFNGPAAEVTRETKGFKDARTTVCPPVSIPRAEFGAPGTWRVKLLYTSPTGSGTSDEQNIDIK